MAWTRSVITPRRYLVMNDAKRTAGLEFLRVAPHHCLNQALVDLSRAFGNFFEGRAAYPKPRRRFENDSFRYPDPAQIKVSAGRAKQVFSPSGRPGCPRLGASVAVEADREELWGGLRPALAWQAAECHGEPRR